MINATPTSAPCRAPARSRRWAGMALAIALGIACTAAADVTGRNADPEAGARALKAAAAERQAAYKQEGAAREAGLLQAAATFGAVADDVSLDLHSRTEGAFRSGELLRARGKVAEAGSRFGQAVTLAQAVSEGEARGFGARAQLELAHALRRDGPADLALEAYGQVGALFPEEARSVGTAADWRARLLIKAGQVEAAQGEARVLEALVALDAAEAVRCADAIALALAEAGEEERARAVVADLDQRIQPLLGASADPKQRLAEARAAMRVTLALEGR